MSLTLWHLLQNLNCAAGIIHTMALYEHLPFGLTMKHWKGWAANPNQNNATDADIDAVINNVTSTTAFIWEPYDGVGHASIYVWDKVKNKGNYVSTFPGGDGIGNKNDAMWSVPVEWMNFRADCFSESSAENFARIPEHIIPLPNLNHAAMLARANDKQKANKDYHFLRRNCSTVAAGVLRAGLSYKQLASVLYYAYCSVWTPTESFWFASAVARRT